MNQREFLQTSFSSAVFITRWSHSYFHTYSGTTNTSAKLHNTFHPYSLTSNLVHVLQRQAEGLVGRTRRRLDGVQSLEQCGAWGASIFTVDLPALEPGHLWRERSPHVCSLARRSDKMWMLTPDKFWARILHPETICQSWRSMLEYFYPKAHSLIVIKPYIIIDV